MTKRLKRAIVIGASSGIGRAVAVELARDGYTVGVAARRIEMLDDIRKDFPAISCVRYMDITNIEESTRILGEMIDELEGMDLIVISSGVDCVNPGLEPNMLRWAVDTNVTGFAALANMSYRYFVTRGEGHICGISSVAALRGSGTFPAYNATKAFVSNYMEGLMIRSNASGFRILVTDIRPGFVETPMTKGQPGMFWVSPPDKVARQILTAIRRGRRVAYVPSRWDFLARIIHGMPYGLYAALTKNEGGKETWDK